ncbi:GNAT family N-acetyltransferase [Paenibacillus caseinilyticus]|uniref:N-acetyltransferase domain-containing protein n=1 Tax=Paenibacillus mucilaginosus K02 TaxID=997761 RepID=I0BKF0_9BACL|nr:GNAT family N-acetyltransferase [Paenibacillus mucilaginosus]AFH62847.1 hypothetical protein B2K_19370 [Paenibacillus mucilaginosus K02]
MGDVFDALPVLETNRLKLRKITVEDVEDMFLYCSKEEVPRYASWNPHKTITETKEAIERVLVQWDNKSLVHWGIEYKENSRLIGTIEFATWDRQHKIAEIGYALWLDLDTSKEKVTMELTKSVSSIKQRRMKLLARSAASLR